MVLQPYPFRRRIEAELPPPVVSGDTALDAALEEIRVLRALVKAVLASGRHGLPLVRDYPTQIYSSKSLDIFLSAPNKVTTVFDKTDLDVGLLLIQTQVNSANIRHRITARTGQGGTVELSSTALELINAGLTSPNASLFWSPSAVGGTPAGNWTLLMTPPAPLTLHETFKFELVNEDTVDAKATQVVILWYEAGPRTRELFERP